MTIASDEAAKAISTAQAVMHAIAREDPSMTELETARKTILMKSASFSLSESIANVWLDGETYKLPANNEADELNRISPADLRRVAARLFEDAATQAIVAPATGTGCDSRHSPSQAMPPVTTSRITALASAARIELAR